MKQRRLLRVFVLCTAIVLSLGVGHSYAQHPRTEFWLSFGKGGVEGALDTGCFGRGIFGTDIYIYIEIQIGTIHQAKGYIRFTHSNDSVPFSVSPGKTFSHRLTYKQAQGCYNRIMWKKDNLSVCVRSDSVVTVSAIIRKKNSTDATLILPVETLGCNYIVFRQNGNITPQEDETCVLVVTQNNTLVVLDGQILCSLDRGETYYFSIPFSASVAQRKIISSKPVALFNVEITTSIPSFGVSDRLYEQYYPINAAGKDFYVPVSDMEQDYVQVMATENNTSITIQGGTVRSDISGAGRLNGLGAGEWTWIEVPRKDSGCFISADKPVQVCSFLPSCNFRDPLRVRTGNGDPAMVWVPPLNQRVRSCVIKSFEIPGNVNEIIPQYRVMVVAPFAGKDSCVVCVNSGKKIALYGGKWRDHPSGWSYYDMLLDKDTTYLFLNNAFGLQAYSYGLATAESYYLLASAKFRNWERSFTANDTQYQKLSELFFCEQEVTFRAEVADTLSHLPGHIYWYIDSVEEPTARDQLVWKKHFTKGTYHIRMAVRYEDTYDTNTYSISSILHIISLEADVFTTPEHCNHSDGKIILSVSSVDPASLTFELDSVGGYGNSIYGLKSGWYNIRIRDSYCEWQCQVHIDSVIGPQADFTISDTTVLEGVMLYFTDRSIPGGAGIWQWHWDMGDNTTLSSNSVSHAYPHKGVYHVQLAVTDSNQCVDTIEKSIRIVSHIRFPNVFAPEGEIEDNRVFCPLEEGGTYLSFDMVIYNRWGNEVWHKCCESGECPRYHDSGFWWDGTDSRGSLLSAGVYFYVVKVVAGQSESQPFFIKGSVTLLR